MCNAMMKKIVSLTRDVIRNLWSNVSGYKLTHVVEANDWAIKNVGTSVTNSLNTHQLLRSRISTTPVGLRNQLIHFDSVHTFIKKRGCVTPHISNKIILTWFHVEPRDPKLALIRNAQRNIRSIHTSCKLTKRTLIEAGIDPDKIVVIPLGVDTSLFTPAMKEQKQAMRKRLGIAPDRVVIGSFQKDGVGWSEGLEPKLIKGPDVLVNTIAQLKPYNPLVLLTGPARGFVKKHLDELGIDYLHTYLQDSRELPAMYRALDLYMITSRVEGGPLSLLEAWASGVPVVSTCVGMVPDLARDGETALLADVENVLALAHQAQRLLDDPRLGDQLASHAAKEVTTYSWDDIARRYFDELYRPLV